jgi:hypothetical protein
MRPLRVRRIGDDAIDLLWPRGILPAGEVNHTGTLLVISTLPTSGPCRMTMVAPYFTALSISGKRAT